MSLGFLNQLMMECFGVEWVRGGKLLDVRFVAPIRPGDTIVVGGIINEINKGAGRAYVECDLFIDKVGGERAVLGRAVSRLTLLRFSLDVDRGIDRGQGPSKRCRAR
jgi:hypothetical protein